MAVFKALWVTEAPHGVYETQVVERDTGDLPAGDVLIRVQYSSLNYKDALSASGNRRVTRKYPHTPASMPPVWSPSPRWPSSRPATR